MVSIPAKAIFVSFRRRAETRRARGRNRDSMESVTDSTSDFVRRSVAMVSQQAAFTHRQTAKF